jgi:hypothetical protein
MGQNPTGQGKCKLNKNKGRVWALIRKTNNIVICTLALHIFFGNRLCEKYRNEKYRNY